MLCDVLCVMYRVYFDTIIYNILYLVNYNKFNFFASCDRIKINGQHCTYPNVHSVAYVMYRIPSSSFLYLSYNSFILVAGMYELPPTNRSSAVALSISRLLWTTVRTSAMRNESGIKNRLFFANFSGIGSLNDGDLIIWIASFPGFSSITNLDFFCLSDASVGEDTPLEAMMYGMFALIDIAEL